MLKPRNTSPAGEVAATRTVTVAGVAGTCTAAISGCGRSQRLVSQRQRSREHLAGSTHHHHVSPRLAVIARCNHAQGGGGKQQEVMPNQASGFLPGWKVAVCSRS